MEVHSSNLTFGTLVKRFSQHFHASDLFSVFPLLPRLVLETWLSFVQPWRYVELSASGGNDGGVAFNSSPQWGGFVSENVEFYNGLLVKALLR